MFEMKYLILLVAFQAGSLKAVGPFNTDDRAGGDCFYNYKDPFSNWATGANCPALCGGGQDQAKGSPINIKTNEVISGGASLNHFPDLSFKNAYKALSGKWSQKTYTFQFDVTSTTNVPTVQYSSENTQWSHNYQLLQVHYHWGADDGQGSEHTVNGRKYPLEAHFVHFNTKYADDVVNPNAPAGETPLLVIGVFYEIGNLATATQNAWVSDQAALAEAWATSASPTATTRTNQENMWNTLKTALEGGHYNYKGGLTTPGCDEVVNWIVAKKALTISSEDLAKFRMLKAPQANEGQAGVAITRNWRPVQDIGTRKVFSMARSWNYGSWKAYYGVP